MIDPKRPTTFKLFIYLTLLKYEPLTEKSVRIFYEELILILTNILYYENHIQKYQTAHFPDFFMYLIKK
ncbi:hypothetical protein J3D55_003962 [Chryseobacterium ginsenosidimutans]|nr:hypothetical protein [Chryseobacterium ginsenosidimutans]